MASPASSLCATRTTCCSGCLKDRFRYLILLLANLTLTSICSNMIIFNFTMIVMTKPGEAIHENNQTITDHNSTQSPNMVRYSQSEKALLIYAVSIGAILA